MLVPYILEGLAKREKCFCAQQPQVIPRIVESLQARGIDVSELLRAGELELHDARDVYGKDGQFDPKKMMERLEAAIIAAREAGFVGLRTAGDLRWAATGDTSCDRIIAYERLVQDAFPNRPATGLCQYDLSSFTPEVRERVVGQHQMSIQTARGETRHTVLSILRDAYLLDIVADRKDPTAVVYYVLQERSKPDVLGWGYAASVGEAISAGESLLRAG